MMAHDREILMKYYHFNYSNVTRVGTDISSDDREQLKQLYPNALFHKKTALISDYSWFNA